LNVGNSAAHSNRFTAVRSQIQDKQNTRDETRRWYRKASLNLVIPQNAAITHERV
jgi:hypothetical protein